MKNTTLYLTFILLMLGFSMAAQNVPNGSFEQWDTITTIVAPKSWSTSDQFYFLGSGGLVMTHTVTRDNTPHSGKYAMKIATDATTFAGTTTYFPGFATTNDSTSRKPTYLVGFYKGNLASKDTAAVVVEFTKWDTATKTSTTVGGGDTIILSSGVKNSYKLFVISLSYTPGMKPDTFNIFMAVTSKNKDSLGYIVVDDLMFSDSIPTVAGLQAAMQNRDFSIYPVPTKDRLNLNLETGLAGNLDISLYDLEGRVCGKIFSGNSSGNQTYSYDVSNLNPGVYFCRLTSGESVITRKVVIQR